MRPDNAELAAKGIQAACVQLVEVGCNALEIISGLTTMLAYSLAAVDCCPQHSAETQKAAIDTLHKQLAVFREDRTRWRHQLEEAGEAQHLGGHI